jgi:putative spermidine/putrescine transport system substrate-binding protein
LTPGSMSRRELLGRSLALAGAAGLGTLAGACTGAGRPAGETSGETLPPAFTGTLRVVGLAVDVNDLTAAAAERNLPFRVELEAASAETLVERARSRPGSFDVLSGSADLVTDVWATGNVVGLDRTRLLAWADVSDLYRVGKLVRANPVCTVGDGDAPFRRLYSTGVDGPGDLLRWGRDDGSGPPEGELEPRGIAGAPGTFAMESIAYDAGVLGLEPDEVSWAELLNARWRGRVALQADPAIGLQDALLAARAAGLVEIGDAGNPTRPQIDAVVRLLRRLKAQGQFRAFWSTFDEAVDLVARDGVVVEAAPWTAVSLLASSGRPVRYAAPPEGLRGWAGLLFVSKAALASPSRLQACYDYLNWWHSGVPGAILMRYGYYSAVQGACAAYVSQDEWDYWIAGKPAGSDLDSPFAQRSIRKGEVRDGGSVVERTCRIAAWRSRFDEAEHARERWREVVGA